MSNTQPARLALANLPTPLVRLSRLPQELRLGTAGVWLKRDDLTGLELSGNKVRKLEYVLADAIESGCDTIVTEGTPQSNHCRATAAACARLGLKAVLLLRPQPPVAGPAGNHLLDELFGAETRVFARPHFDEHRERIVAEVLAEQRAAGRRPRWTPAGASEPLGLWGYIRQAAELAVQLREAGLDGCDVVCAVSSGGTYAGLVAGMLLHKLDRLRMFAVPVSDDEPYHRREATRLIRDAAAQFGLPIELREEDLRFLNGYVGEGYAKPYRESVALLRTLARCEGVLLDPVYTAKAFFGMVDGLRRGRIGRNEDGSGRPVVFVHTGGVFSNFSWPRLLMLDEWNGAPLKPLAGGA